MSKRLHDRLKELEAKLLPKPEVKRPSSTFVVKPTLAALDDWKGEEAKARAAAIAAGMILTPDARGVLGEFESHEESEAWCMAQQARLIAEAQPEIDALNREAERKQEQAAVGTKPEPKPQPRYVRASDLLHHA